MPQAMTAGGSDPQASSSSWNARSDAVAGRAPGVGQAQHLALAQQVAHRLPRLLRVPAALELGLAPVHPRLARQELDRLVEVHAPEVQLDVDDDPAGAPDLVVEAHETHGRVVEEALRASISSSQ